jgi:hypothetical protein
MFFFLAPPLSLLRSSCCSSVLTTTIAMGTPKGKRTGGSGATAVKDKATGWDASTFSKADLNKLCAAGLLAAAMEVMMPGEEIVPRPQESFRVMFTQFLFLGLSIPVHELLRGLLFVYGVQLH